MGTRLLTSLRDAGPWFVDRPGVTVATAALLFGATFSLRFLAGDVTGASPLLFTLPIALLAASFGRIGGLAGGAVSVLLLVGWQLFGEIGLTPLGWVTRVVPLILLGLLLGDAMDRLRRAEAQRIRLIEAERRHREAVQLNDTIVQSLSAAKWALEAADLEGGLAIVDQTLAQSNRLVSDLIRGAELRPLWMGEAAPEPTSAERR